MGNNNHHHVDDLSGFSLFRVIWPAALLLIVIFVGRNICNEKCCSGESCTKTEQPKDHDHNEAAHEVH